MAAFRRLASHWENLPHGSYQVNFESSISQFNGTMRDMESWAVCYCHFKKCQCKCTFTVIMIDIFKKTVKLT
jgi:hypothetical protein